MLTPCLLEQSLSDIVSRSSIQSDSNGFKAFPAGVLSVATSYKPGVTVSCTVAVTQGSSGTYLAATSAAKVFNFR